MGCTDLFKHLGFRLISFTETANSIEKKEPLPSETSASPFISKRQFLDKFRACIRQESVLDRTQARTFIDSCVNDIYGENIVSRSDMLRYVTAELDSNGVQFDVDLFNDILEMYVRHRLNFLPSVFLREMSPNKPNDMTHKLLLERYALSGDVKSAVHHVKQLEGDAETNQDVAGWLAHAFVKKGDLKTANKLLSSAKKKIQTADDRMHVPLICAYAELGNENLLREALFELSEESCGVGRMFEFLALGGHAGIISRILKDDIHRCTIEEWEQVIRRCLLRGDHPMASLFVQHSTRRGASISNIYLQALK